MNLNRFELFTVFFFLVSLLAFFYLNVFSYPCILNQNYKGAAVEVFESGGREFAIVKESKKVKDGARIYRKRSEVQVVVRKGTVEVWRGAVLKGSSVEELALKINIDMDDVIERDKKRTFNRNKSVIHIRA